MILAGLALAGCDRRSGPPASQGEATAPAATGPIYRLEVVPPEPCKAGATCAVRVRLHALGPFHVNREYPFKFVATPTAGVEHDGAAGFAIDDDRTGTLTVPFRAAAAGTAKVSGTFKLSVCSEDTCEIESEPLAIDVPVT